MTHLRTTSKKVYLLILALMMLAVSCSSGGTGSGGTGGGGGTGGNTGPSLDDAEDQLPPVTPDLTKYSLNIDTYIDGTPVKMTAVFYSNDEYKKFRQIFVQAGEGGYDFSAVFAGDGGNITMTAVTYDDSTTPNTYTADQVTALGYKLYKYDLTIKQYLDDNGVWESDLDPTGEITRLLIKEDGNKLIVIDLYGDSSNTWISNYDLKNPPEHVIYTK